MTPERAVALVFEGVRVRIRSGAVGCEAFVMAEGTVIAYAPAPTITIKQDDGSLSSWQITLPIDEVTG